MTTPQASGARFLQGYYFAVQCSWLQTVSKFEDKIKCKVFEKLNHKAKGIVGTHVKKMNITALHLEIQDKSVDADRQS